jgi:DNA (cytosine-5)-methyltransferase 1
MKRENLWKWVGWVTYLKIDNTSYVNYCNEEMFPCGKCDKSYPTENKLQKHTRRRHAPPLRVLDLFCGCGGMTQGLKESGMHVVAGIDVWDKAIESYSANHSHTAICADLTALSPEQFQAQYNPSQESIDVIVGGPPCQGFSIAGKRDTNDPRNSLFMEFKKYLDYFQPKAFIMENVIGILSMKTAEGDSVIDIITTLLSEYYELVVCKLYASDFEVPQNRRRTIIIGLHKRLGLTPTAPEPVLDVDDRPPVGPVLLPRDQVPESYFLSQRAIQGIRNKKAKSQREGKGFGAQFLDVTRPSYTIPARYWKDGYDALVKYDEETMRRLTELELKRIQSFPDDYILKGTKKDVIMQIGNAVACRFAYHLGRHIQGLLLC